MPRRRSTIPIYFTALELENVRCFGERQTLDLLDENGRPARWTLILGENGVGKTTLLQSLAWMRPVPRVPENLSGGSPDVDPSGEPPPLKKGTLEPALPEEENTVLEGLLRAGTPEHVALKATLSFGWSLPRATKRRNASANHKVIRTEATLTFAKRALIDFDIKKPTDIAKDLGEYSQPLIIAYGANRQLGALNLKSADLVDPIASRLAGVTELYDAEEILGKLDYASLAPDDDRGIDESKHLDRLKEVLSRVLPNITSPDDIKIYPPDVLDRPWEPSGVCFQTYSGLVKLSALSLGYQSALAWTTDLAWRLLKNYPNSPDPLAEPAVVLVDEIDLHLHPVWQLRIIDDLCRTFTGTQFIATSHSPLIVQVAETANLVLLRKRETDVEIVNDPDVVRSWRVDQILSSELFGIPAARNPKTEHLFRRRDELVDKPSRSAAEEAELKRLRNEIAKLPTAQDPNDQEALDFIRKAADLLKNRKAQAR